MDHHQIRLCDDSCLMASNICLCNVPSAKYSEDQSVSKIPFEKYSTISSVRQKTTILGVLILCCLFYPFLSSLLYAWLLVKYKSWKLKIFRHKNSDSFSDGKTSTWASSEQVEMFVLRIGGSCPVDPGPLPHVARSHHPALAAVNYSLVFGGQFWKGGLSTFSSISITLLLNDSNCKSFLRSQSLSITGYSFKD